MVFHWSLSDSKSPRASRTLLSILAVLNNVVVWIISTPLPTSKSSSPSSNPLVTAPKAPIIICIIETCMFHSFFPFPSKVEVLILLFRFFQFYSVISRNSKVDNFAYSLFCCWLQLGLVFWPRLGDPCVCQSPLGVYVLLLLLLFTPQEFFISVLADGFSQEFEWQQVSSSLQDSSQYSGRLQQCCRLDSLHPSANFQVLKAL